MDHNIVRDVNEIFLRLSNPFKCAFGCRRLSLHLAGNQPLSRKSIPPKRFPQQQDKEKEKEKEENETR